MSYQALYRKFRPRTFEEVKGQDAVVTTLRNQIKNDRLAHAYLFTGTRGTGKTSIAKLFARAVNCESPVDGSPCGECAVCREIASGASLNVTEQDAASNNGVEDVRQIIEEITYPPTTGKYKVYIIDEVHMLSTAAFNALLKTLEEPPSYVIFILATTEVHKIPITILSRCQRYDFRRIDLKTIADRMRELMDKEGNRVEDRALLYIARCADGSMRDALSLLDQCLAFYMDEELTYDGALKVLGAVDVSVFSKLLSFILAGDVAGAIRLLDEAVMLGRELSQFVADFIGYLRNLMLVKASEEIDDVVNVSTEHRKVLISEAESIDDDTLMRYIRVFSTLSGDIRYSTQKRVLVEIALIRLCRPQGDGDLSGLMDRVRAVEEKLEKGVPAAPVYVTAPGPGAGVRPAPVEPKKLKKALAEDVKQAVGNWSRVLAELDAPYRSCAKAAKLSVDEDTDTLLLVFDNKTFFEAFDKDRGGAAMKEALEKATGCEMDFRLKLLSSNESFEKSYVDIAREQINFNIEEE